MWAKKKSFHGFNPVCGPYERKYIAYATLRLNHRHIYPGVSPI